MISGGELFERTFSDKQRGICLFYRVCCQHDSRFSLFHHKCGKFVTSERGMLDSTALHLNTCSICTPYYAIHDSISYITRIPCMSSTSHSKKARFLDVFVQVQYVIWWLKHLSHEYALCPELMKTNLGLI